MPWFLYRVKSEKTFSNLLIKPLSGAVFLLFHREGRSVPKSIASQNLCICPTANAGASACTALTIVAPARMDGAARRGARAQCLWDLFAQITSVSRGRSCSSNRVNAAATAATWTKWHSRHSTGCTEIHTCSQTSGDNVHFWITLWLG